MSDREFTWLGHAGGSQLTASGAFEDQIRRVRDEFQLMREQFDAGIISAREMRTEMAKLTERRDAIVRTLACEGCGETPTWSDLHVICACATPDCPHSTLRAKGWVVPHLDGCPKAA